MKVYVVYRIGHDYDYDEDVLEMKMFFNKADAEAYRETRKTKDGLYWDRLVEREVE